MARSISVSPARRSSTSNSPFRCARSWSIATMLLVSERATMNFFCWRSSATGNTRQRLERRRVDDDASQVHRLQPELFRQRVAQRRLGHEAELHQQLSYRHVLLGLLEQRDAQLVLGQDSLVDQDLADVPLCLRIGG